MILEWILDRKHLNIEKSVFVKEWVSQAGPSVHPTDFERDLRFLPLWLDSWFQIYLKSVSLGCMPLPSFSKKASQCPKSSSFIKQKDAVPVFIMFVHVVLACKSGVFLGLRPRCPFLFSVLVVVLFETRIPNLAKSFTSVLEDNSC